MERLPERLAHHLARPVRPDPADLGRDEAGVFERLFGDVVPELFACPSARAPGRFPVPGSVRAASRARICSSRSRSRVAGREQLRVFGDDLGADLFRVPVRGQVGAGEEHLPAAGRDRHEAVQRDRVADRPGRDDDDDPGEQDRGPSRAPRRQSPRPSRAKTTSAEQQGDARYSGRTRARRAEQRARHQPARPAPSRSAAQSIASTAPDSSVAASGSLISIPWYSSSAG